MQNGQVEMEIAGSAFFTIVNLFTARGMMDENSPYCERLKRPEEFKSVDLTFGRLAWAEQGDEIHALFQPGTEKDMDAKKRPFGPRFPMDPGTIFISYLNALQYGISDPALVLPDHTSPLKDRVRQFLKARTTVEYSDRPLLVAYGWLHSATRIIKRLLANGGKDESFYEDICQRLESRLAFDLKQNPAYVQATKAELRKEFLFREDTLSFYFPSMRTRHHAMAICRICMKSFWKDIRTNPLGHGNMTYPCSRMKSYS